MTEDHGWLTPAEMQASKPWQAMDGREVEHLLTDRGFLRLMEWLRAQTINRDGAGLPGDALRELEGQRSLVRRIDRLMRGGHG